MTPSGVAFPFFLTRSIVVGTMAVIQVRQLANRLAQVILNVCIYVIG